MDNRPHPVLGLSDRFGYRFSSEQRRIIRKVHHFSTIATSLYPTDSTQSRKRVESPGSRHSCTLSEWLTIC